MTLAVRTPPAVARTSPSKKDWVIYAAALAVAAVAYLVNLRGALDFDLDEVMYTIAGQNVAGAGSVSWGIEPTAVHPPGHFLLLGGWMLITGTAHADTIDALMSVRYLGALFSVLTVALAGLLARRYTRNGWLVGAVMVIVAFDGFLLRFGRTGLIEATAVFAGLLVVYLAVRLRHAASPIYLGVVGIASGIALLIKEPLLFTIGVPLLAAVLERDWTYFRRATAAAGIGGLIWGAFPLWAVLGGAGRWWWSEHDTSLNRLAGFLQVSGLNRTGVPASGVFTDTLRTYAGGYLIFGIGAVGLLVLIFRGGLFHKRRLSTRDASLVAFGVLSYGFLAYCVLLGQANEQLSVYSVCPAVLLCVLAWGPAPRLTGIICAVTAIVGVALWGLNIAAVRDDGTERMGTFLATNYSCVPVNATGNALRWAPALTRNHVESFTDGGAALRAGIRLFLLSPKDSRMLYGNSSPTLDHFVRSYGTPLRSFPSRRYERLELWSVPTAIPASRDCGNTRPPVSTQASAARFLMLAGALIGLVALVMYTWHAVARRREWAREWAAR
ncbi:glycosyltransferase family 39 protein [Actinoplanes sp. TFC3]|uniref:ArnT family glycosyltransferase n=1 Tax=Actinoplanes sp. TFC3 TaxID=1710355 RepID=UPI000831906E|nr:phospholipid carrier-dependent glycosyltransferase [Actinoplanes sp. TFC3]